METEEIDKTLKNCRLRCTDLPKELLTRTSVKSYFEQFGKVVRVILKPRSRSCIVEYDTFENAQYVLSNANNYMGHIFTINWYENPSKKKRVRKDPDPNWTPDPEVEAELAAMAATGTRFKKKYNLRPEGMTIDEFLEPKPPTKVRKPRILKKTTTNDKVDKTKKEKHSNAWTSEQLELLNTLKQPSFTAEEKYKVLEARDKLIRLRNKQDTDLTKATHRVGTCSDMCPEKERLLRVIQHQVAFYEQDSAGRGMNPSLAVKQYSRSSADQEVPLPHELRPVEVLQLTMEYLMHRIMNLCDTPDVNLTEWYHFLWDRTRSIRKDITQQELCSQGSVALLEQCTRFHIHCSARLVAEDPSVFDQKINTENLTKCLQTLKYMYHDLNLKGESCPNEAEFRAYVILLNLNDGNFMWEVQQLKLEIQKSPAVKFALEVYSAIDKNNYVKFFKLVQSTNYLNACILLRYFVQVRTKALSTIVKCYSPRTPYTQFALVELEKLLAFEDMASVKEFVLSYGLELNEENTHIILNRRNFQLPEVPYTLERAIKVVETKRTTSVGQVIYGGIQPPPKFQNYIPSNSFDQNGIFIIPDTMIEIFKSSSITKDQTDSATTTQKFEHLPKPVVTAAPNALLSKVPFSVETAKTTDPSAPFWSLSKPSPSSSIFKIDKNEPPPNSGVFSMNKSKTISKSIFGYPTAAEGELRNAPSVFGGTFQTSKTEPPSISTSNSNSQQQNIFENIPTTSMDIFGSKEVHPKEFTPNQIDFGLYPAQQQNWFSKFPRTSTLTMPNVPNATVPVNVSTDTKPFITPTSRSLVKSSQSVQEQMDLVRLEELEKRIRLEKEKEAQRKREIEVEKRKAELKQKQLAEERRRKEEKQRLAAERWKIKEEQQRIALQKEKERKLEQEIKKSVALLMDELLTKVEENYKQELFEKIRNNIRRHKMLLFTKKWLDKVTTNKRKRKAMDQNPIWLPSRNVNEEAQELFTDMQKLTLRNIKRYKMGKPAEIVLPPENPISKLNVAEIYKVLLTSYSKICQRMQKEMFWKVTISLPDFHELKFGLNYLEDVLMNYFDWPERYGSTSIVKKYVAENRLGYCIEKKQGPLLTEGNSNGLLFIANEPSKLLLQRITSICKPFPKSAAVPVYIIFLNKDIVELDTEQLEDFLEANVHVASYKIAASTLGNSELIEAIKEGLEFLAELIEAPAPPLELNTLKNLFYTHVATEPWERIRTYAAWNSKYRSCLRSPNLVINLYNEAVEKLKDIIIDKSSLEYQNFPDEFDKLLLNQVPEILPCDYRYFPSFWKSESYQDLLIKTVNSLRIPTYKSTWPPLNESDLECDIFTYCSQIFNQPQPIFYKVMAVLLENVDPADNFNGIQEVLWVNVIEVIAIERLCQTDFSLKHTEFHTKSIFEQLFAVYNTKTLSAYSDDEWFYLKNPSIETEMKRNRGSKKIKRKSPNVSVSLEDIDLDELEKSVREESKIDISQNKSSIEEIESLMADLEESMEIHKAICSKFQSNAQKALNTHK